MYFHFYNLRGFSKKFVDTYYFIQNNDPIIKKVFEESNNIHFCIGVIIIYIYALHRQAKSDVDL